jgi:hypothetical protein
MAVSNNQFEIAKRRGKERAVNVPHAVSVVFDPNQRLLVIELSSRAIICFRDHDLQGLAGVDSQDLQDVRILGDGYAIHFPVIDQDFYLPALFDGFLGTKHWMAEMAKKGGQSTSAAKKAAAQANGRKGGRPRNERSEIA